MQIDQDLPSSAGLKSATDVQESINCNNSDENMKSTVSTDEKEKEGINNPQAATSVNHAERIKRIHSQRVLNYLKTEMQKMP